PAPSLCYGMPGGLQSVPGGGLADVDAADLVDAQVLDSGVGGVDDNRDAVHGQNGGGSALRGLLVLQLTAGHADGVGAVQSAGHACGGVGGHQLDGGVGVDGAVGFDQLLHQGADGG